MYEITSDAKSCGSVSIGIVSMSIIFVSSCGKYDVELVGLDVITSAAVVAAEDVVLAALNGFPTYGSYFDLNSFQAFVRPICNRENSWGI